MTKKYISCPACGSTNVFDEEVTRTYTPPFGETIEYVLTIQSCGTCGESGDFAHENDPIIHEIIKNANAASAHNLVQYLREQKYQLCGSSIGVDAYIERAMRLPQGTLVQWEKGNITPEGLALLRLLRYDPELVDVVDNDYKPFAE